MENSVPIGVMMLLLVAYVSAGATTIAVAVAYAVWTGRSIVFIQNFSLAVIMICGLIAIAAGITAWKLWK